MGPALPTPKKQCYTVLILQIFGKGVSRHESGILFRKGKSLAQSAGRPACEKSLRARRLNRGWGDSQDKAIMEAIHDEEFTEPVNAQDWDAYIYDLAFCLERKLGVYL